MAIKTILTVSQTEILNLISKNDFIYQNFYLGGGTALAEFYLHHRLSEDLDFFSETEFDPQSIWIFLKTIQKKLGIKKIDYEQSFNRNLFFLHLEKEIIKTEFTFYPFPRIEKSQIKFEKLQIDSLTDIAVNKIFTIYQKARSRDFIDLYFIFQQNKLELSDLVKKAKIKFDWHVDPLRLGTQLLQANSVKDHPHMLKKLDHQVWQDFFLKEAKKLKKNILK